MHGAPSAVAAAPSARAAAGRAHRLRMPSAIAARWPLAAAVASHMQNMDTCSKAWGICMLRPLLASLMLLFAASRFAGGRVGRGRRLLRARAAFASLLAGENPCCACSTNCELGARLCAGMRRRAMARASRACAVVAMRAGWRGGRRSARVVVAGTAGARADLSSGTWDVGGPRGCVRT